MILINEPKDFSEISIKNLQQLGQVFCKGDNYDNNKIKIIFVRIAEMIDSNFLDNYPSLQYLVSPTTGLTHIDLDETKKRKIKIISLKGHIKFLNNIYATAEHTLALTLSILRHIRSATQSVKEGIWNRYLFKGNELAGRCVFLIGYGRVGKQVSKLYEAFGAKVIAYDIDNAAVPQSKKVTLNYGLEVAQIISIHIPFSKKNIGFFNRKLFSLIRPDSIFINTSRGEIVDQEALIDHLIKNKFARAGLDVLCDEPTPLNKSFMSALDEIGDRLVITPHIAGFTMESLEKVENYVVKNLIEEVLK